MKLFEYDSSRNPGSNDGGKQATASCDDGTEYEVGPASQDDAKKSFGKGVVTVLLMLCAVVTLLVMYNLSADDTTPPQSSDEIGAVEGFTYEQMLARTCLELEEMDVIVQADAKNAMLFGIGTGAALAQSAPEGYTPEKIADDLTDTCAQ